MRADSPNWVVLGEPASPAEAEALNAFRELLPEDGLTRAWVNITFIDRNGRLAEVDVVLLTRRGLFVVELKGWHGRIDGNQQTWRLTTNVTEHRKNPLLLTDNKAKRLGTLLQEVNPKGPKLPYVGALVVLHGRDSQVALDELGRTGVLALDGYGVKGGLPRLSDFLAEPPEKPQWGVDRTLATAVRKACDRAGFQKTPQQRKVGQYVLDDSEPVATGPDWQDFTVTHPALGDKRRLRLYDVPPQASADDRARIEQTARRELRLTETLRHEGIDSPLDLLVTDSGPALLFPFVPGAVSLGEYLAATATTLEFDDRLALVRQLGDILRYAHNRRLAHRTLAPGRVWVVPDGNRVRRLMVRDWYTGQRESSSRTKVTALSAGVTDLRGAVADEDWIYLAPESLHGAADLPSVPLDVYGLGALAYLILTGEPPARTLSELQQKFEKQGYLDPSAVSAAIPDAYAEVVREATATAEPLRTSSIGEVLAALESAAKQVKPPEQSPTPVADPLDAQADDVVADRFIVDSRRGEGSTGTALLVVDTMSESDRPVILKLARNESAVHRLEVEAEVLRSLDHPRVVRLLEGPMDVEGRRGLLLTDAGRETLAGRIEKEGRATIEQLERYGRDLLEAVAHLDERGVFHRDIKPANLAIAPDPGTRKPRLTLFDLSLAREPLENIDSGTAGYLDPYLRAQGRRQFDRAAELWAVSATLFEMATGNLPWWQEGGAGPLTPDEAPVVIATSFEDAVAPQLTELFRRALAPRVKERFGGVAELAAAWQAAFAALDEVGEQAEGDEGAAGAATLTTPLSAAGLSARALSGLARLDVLTVGDLLGVPPTKINQIRGLGERYRKEIQKRVREWRARLAVTSVTDVVPGRGVEGMVRALLTLPRSSAADEDALHAVLGLTATTDAHGTWPTMAEAAQAAGCSLDAATAALNRAVKRWRSLDAVQETIEDLVSLLQREGRVMTLVEASTALAGQQGSQLEGAARHQRTAALIRVLLEVEEREVEPRLSVRRRERGIPLIALTESADRDGDGRAHPPADLLTDLAIELGEHADALVARGVVPALQAKSELRTRLRSEVELSDERLVRLAAAASATAAASSSGELYPRTLPVTEAVAHALRGLPGRVISEMWVRRRVFARFPDLEGVVPPRPKLDDLVTTALPGMGWDGKQYAAKDSTGTSRTATSYLTSVGALPGHDVDRTLRISLKQHSAMTLAVLPARYAKAVRKLPAQYDLGVVDVARLVVEAAHQLAEADGVDWDVVLRADAAERGSSDWQLLTDLVAEAMVPRWRAALAADRPLLVTNAGPLMRYGMSELLSALLDVGTPRPAARWLLVARDKSTPVPLLDGQSVPLGPSGALDLPADLDTLDIPSSLGAQL